MNYSYVTENDLRDALQNNKATYDQAFEEFSSQNKHIPKESITFEMLFNDLLCITKAKHYWDCKCILHN